MYHFGPTTLALVLVSSCGRIDFDATPSGGGDAAIDAIPVSNGLVAFYPMEDLVQFGSQLDHRTTDATGHGHDAACSGTACPVLVLGRSRLGAQFTGTGQRMFTSGSPQDLETTSEFTVTAWISISALPQTRGCVATKMLGTQQFNSWAICVEPNGTLFFYTVTGATANNLFSQATVSLNTWHNVAIQWFAGAKFLVLDGRIDVFTSAMTDFDGGPISIGADFDNGAIIAPFNGLIDEVRIYNRALSPGELMELAQ